MILWNFVEVRGDRHGTGYFISEDRVLTSCHVVGNRDEVKLVGHRPGARAEWAGTTVWRGKGSFDVAVVEVSGAAPKPPGLIGFNPRPLDTDGQSWSSRGCCDGARPPGSNNLPLLGLEGTAFAFDEGAADFQINITTQASRAESWQGISGAPVFVGGRLLGVIRWLSKDFPQSLRAVAIPTLLAQDEGFRQAVGWQEQTTKGQWAKIEAEIHRILTADDWVTEALAEALDEQEGPYDAGNSAELARRLCRESSFSSSMRVLHQVHRRLRSSNEGRRKSLQVLEVLLSWLLPLHCEEQFLGTVTALGGGAWLSLPIATPTVAEMYMAWLDGRKLDLEAPEDPRGRARPRRMAPALPESGSLAHQSISDFALDLDRQMQRDPALKSWVRRLAGRFLSQEDASELAGRHDYGSRVIGRVRDVLEFQAEYHEEHHYLLFDSTFADKHRELLRQLVECLPMRQIELTGDTDQADFEFKTLLPLHDLLYRIHQEGDP